MLSRLQKIDYRLYYNNYGEINCLIISFRINVSTSSFLCQLIRLLKIIHDTLILKMF